MNFRSDKLWFSLASVLIYSFISAQIITEVPTDSTSDNKGKIIENLEENKDKNGFNRLIHKLFIRNPKSRKAEKTSERSNPHLQSFDKAEGKIIRNIHIETFDPFGYSVTDSTKVPTRFTEKAGNTLHIKTKKFVVRNYLLQKKGDVFDSVKIIESERLLRRQRFSRRVQIDYKMVNENSDSVDVYVRSLDSWTIFPNATYSNSKLGFRLRDRNFMGWGHDFDNYYRQNFETGDNRFQTRYTIPNIQKTFISLGVGYSSNEENEYTKGISVQRRFFSPLTRWAGGAYIGQRAYQDSIPNTMGFEAQDFKYNLKDFWGGYAFRLFNVENAKNNRFSNLIVSTRYFNVDYNKIPDLVLDPEKFYANEDFFLLGIGFSQRAYVQDKFIRNYDIIEDIPVGMSFGLTSGIQRKNKIDRFYLSGGFKQGNYYKFGYLGYEIQYGGYLKGNYSEQSVFSLSTNYFTRLMTWDRWKFRSFISSNLIIGNNRANSRGDRLTLNENDPLGINGFYSHEVIGTKKWLTDIQIQSYSPYQFLGFRLSPIFKSTIGLISDSNHSLTRGKVYAKVGLGLLLTNDYLVFSNFQISFAWYNTIPGQGDNVFKTNTFQISDYEFMDFDFGKPELIEYNPYVTH